MMPGDGQGSDGQGSDGQGSGGGSCGGGSCGGQGVVVGGSGEQRGVGGPSGTGRVTGERSAGTGAAGELTAVGRGHRRARQSAGRRRRRRRLGAGVLGVALVAVLAYGVVWFDTTVHEGPAGASEIVTVPSGASAGVIAGTLAKRHVVASSLAFEAYLFLKGTPSIGPGDYLLHRHQAFGAVLGRLARGPDVFPVDVQVGTTVAELAQQVGTEVPGWTPSGFTAPINDGAVRSPWEGPGTPNLDGLLGTGTYLVMPGERVTTLLQQMVGRFDAAAAASGLATASAADGITPYQAVTIASIVQKEGYYPQNFGGVSRVIFNRLNAGMPLQMDSTVLYALNQDGGPVTPADEQVRSPYNSYLHRGLPPTPICFPSGAALTAALHPPPGAWLYFQLVRKNGTMAFEDTLAQHNADIALAHRRGLP